MFEQETQTTYYQQNTLLLFQLTLRKELLECEVVSLNDALDDESECIEYFVADYWNAMRVLHFQKEEQSGNQLALNLLIGQQYSQQRLKYFLILQDLRIDSSNQIVLGCLSRKRSLSEVD